MDSALAQAQEAVRLADTDPGRAVPIAAAAVRRAQRERDPQAMALAQRAWGHGLLQTGEADAALRHLRRSIVAGQAAGIAALVGEARSKLAYALVMRGRPRSALAEVDLALGELEGVAVARAQAQRAVILSEIGRIDEALVDFRAALPELRAAGDELSVARLLVNRGIAHAQRHSFSAAITDLREAESISRRLGRHLAIGIIAENLGHVEVLRGDVPAALSLLDRAEEVIGSQGGHVASVLHDRGVLLLSVGLADEAARAADRAVTAFQRDRRHLKVPEVRLLLAQAALLANDPGEASTHARRARREFSRQQRTEWSSLATLTVIQADMARGVRVRGYQADAAAVALSRGGWPASALEARVLAAIVARQSGRATEATAHLTAASRSARRSGPAALRARGWYAEALLRLDRGAGTSGVLAAIRNGLRILDEHAASLGASDLRVRSAVHRGELTDLGLRLAMEDGRPAVLFEWAERSRASRLAHRRVRPPADPHLADLLSELRRVALDLSDVDGGGDSRLVRRQLLLERQIRDHTRRRPGVVGPMSAPVAPAELAHRLAGRSLVEFVRMDGIMYGLSLVRGRLRTCVVGPVEPIDALIQRLPFALHRLAGTTGRDDARRAALVLLHQTARHLDDLLLGPFTDLDDGPLVVVPTDPLHSVPWSILPSCAGRPLVVSPSATLWHAAHSIVGTGGVAVAAGPGLPGARQEAEQVAAIHGCTPLVGADANADAVLTAIAESRLMHLSAHGRLSVHNPLFSALLLADGPLVVYDLERLGRAPHTVVLAACDAGRSAVYSGGELLGLSSALMTGGTAQLVASVMPIPDTETAPLMVVLHQGLAAGQPPAMALANAQAALRSGDPATLAASVGFVCIGSGFDPPCPA
jgi:tetratricopeptide (TPR) repeat protein